MILTADSEVKIDDVLLVFDNVLWDNKDIGDNSQFWKPASIVALTEHRWGHLPPEKTATVRFHHDNRISKGHFISGMRTLDDDSTVS